MVSGKVLPTCMFGAIVTENAPFTDALGFITPRFTLGVLMVIYGLVLVRTAVAASEALCPLLRLSMLIVTVSPGSNSPLPFPEASLIDMLPIASAGAFII